MTDIAPFDRADLPALQRMADEALGAGYVAVRRFGADTVLVARAGETPVGFVQVEPGGAEWTLKTIVVDVEVFWSHDLPRFEQ